MASSVVVLESFVGNPGKAGEPDVLYRKGDLIKADNPAVKKWPQFFGEPEHRHDAEPAPEKKAG